MKTIHKVVVLAVLALILFVGGYLLGTRGYVIPSHSPDSLDDLGRTVDSDIDSIGIETERYADLIEQHDRELGERDRIIGDLKEELETTQELADDNADLARSALAAAREGTLSGHDAARELSEAQGLASQLTAGLRQLQAQGRE